MYMPGRGLEKMVGIPALWVSKWNTVMRSRRPPLKIPE